MDIPLWEKWNQVLASSTQYVEKKKDKVVTHALQLELKFT